MGQFRLKNNEIAIVFLVFAFITTAFYKYFKQLLKTYWSIDPTNEYYLFQSICTLYRIMGFFLSFMIIRWGVKTVPIFKLGNQRLFAYSILFVVIYFFLRIAFLNIQLPELHHFSLELFFNFFTGLWEESVFTCILFLSLQHFFGSIKAAIVTSLYFSAWHFDVISFPADYISLFLHQILYCFAFRAGFSLMGLAFGHFLWDQIVWGFVWKVPESFDNLSYNLILWSVTLFAFLFVYRIEKKNVENH